MTADAAVAHVRFEVVRDLPMVVVDLETPDAVDAPVLLQDNLFRTLVDRGLAVLPRFFGLSLPQGARVGFTLTDDELRLEDEQETRLLRVPRDGVDPAWLAAAKRLRGTMLLVGRDLGVDPDQSPGDLCQLLEASSRQQRVAGAIVGVAEPVQGLPLIF
jgi:hypothetical protein